jgi:CheY-like chemotaxis protein
MAKEKILVVDDEEDILELVEYNLTKNGYGAICAATGEDALNAARSELPDLIVLDLMLPGVDGLEVCKILKNDPRTSRIPDHNICEEDVVSFLRLVRRSLRRNHAKAWLDRWNVHKAVPPGRDPKLCATSLSQHPSGAVAGLCPGAQSYGAGVEPYQVRRHAQPCSRRPGRAQRAGPLLREQYPRAVAVAPLVL